MYTQYVDDFDTLEELLDFVDQQAEEMELGGVPVQEWIENDTNLTPRIPWYDDDDIVGGNKDIMSDDEDAPTRRSQYIDHLTEIRDEHENNEIFDEIYDELFPNEEQNCTIDSDVE